MLKEEQSVKRGKQTPQTNKKTPTKTPFLNVFFLINHYILVKFLTVKFPSVIAYLIFHLLF